jgi:hypothetical protein
MLLLSLCISVLLGWSIVGLLGKRHYVIFFLLFFPLFVALKISGLLLRGAIMPTPRSQLDGGAQSKTTGSADITTS